MTVYELTPLLSFFLLHKNINRYENFTAANPAECNRLHSDIVRAVVAANAAFESVLKLRVGAGMEIATSFGNFCRRTEGDEVYVY